MTPNIPYCHTTCKNANRAIYTLRFFINSENHRPFFSKTINFALVFRYNKFRRFCFFHVLVKFPRFWNHVNIFTSINLARKSKQ